MLCRRTWSRSIRVPSAIMIGVGLLSLLVLPKAWSLSSVLVPGHGGAGMRLYDLRPDAGLVPAVNPRDTLLNSRTCRESSMVSAD